MSVKKFFVTVLVWSVVVNAFFVALPAYAAGDLCFCATDLSKVTPKDDLAVVDEICKPAEVAQSCSDVEGVLRAGIASHLLYFGCDSVKYDIKVCQNKEDSWKQDKIKLQTDSKNLTETTGFFGTIPKCLLQDNFSPQCRDISVFILLFINWGSGSFAIIGSFALIFFIYGGVNLIVSGGNPEKVKKGTDAMLAAVIGLFIAFAGYMVIKFLGEAVGLKPEYRLLSEAFSGAIKLM